MDDAERGRIPGGRGLFATVFVRAVAEFSAWIAVLVVAYEDGGSPAAGLAVVIQLVPAALAAPVATAAGDRFARHRVLGLSFAVQGLTAAGIALALLTESPLPIVYVLAAIFSIAITPAPATVASLLVHHARTPLQLMRWNATQAFVAALGTLAGPLLTALVLAVADPTAVFAGLAVICGITAAMAALRLPRDDRLPSTLSIRTVLTDARQGVAYVATTPGPRRVVGYIGATEMLIGALDLVFVAVAFDQLGRGGSAVALLTVAFAAGTLLAAALTGRHPGWQLRRLSAVGAALLTLPLLLLGETTIMLAVVALTALLGAGAGLVEIGTATLLQRSCSETMTSRAYGVRDSAALLAAAIGAAIAGPLIDGRGLASTLVLLALVGAVVLIGGAIRLLATERLTRPADPELVARLREVTFLEPLPQPTLDRLAQVSELRSVPAGTVVVAEGEHGAEYFLLTSGAAAVSVGGEVVDELAAPASFGEIALLHDVVRQATITTTAPADLVVISRNDFLDAISRTATSHRGALAVAARYWGPTAPD